MPVQLEASQPNGGVSLLEMLRDATQQQHAAIENVIRLDASFTLQRYIATLQAFDGFLYAWETMAAAALPDRLRPWFWNRSRGALARQDLKHLRASRGSGEFCTEHLNIAPGAEVWGGMYVIEGSSLGGQIIAKILTRKFGITVDNGGAFFGSRGAGTARLWGEFCAVMATEVGEAQPAHAQACQGAIQTFEILKGLFTKTLAWVEGGHQEPAES